MARSSEDTKKDIAVAIKELMKTTSLERISVIDIVRKAGVSRQTFYRNFRDKYDLVNWYFDLLAAQCFFQMGVTVSLREGLILKFKFIRNERSFFAQAFRSTDCNSVMEHDYLFILEFYTIVIEKKLRHPLSDDLRFILELYCHGSISMTVDWAVSGMLSEPEKLADDLIDALPPKLASILIPAL